MASLSLTISYEKNTGAVLSPTEFIMMFLFGTLPMDIYGNLMDDDTIAWYISSAQKEVEDNLVIKLQKTYIEENRDYMYDDWIQWGYIPCTYPVVAFKKLQGYINTSLQIEYPVEWMKAKSQSPDKDMYHRNISLVPVSGGLSVVGNGQVYFGVAPYVGFFGNRIVPSYWTSQYVTGFDVIPPDVLRYIGMMAALSLLPIMQDAIFGGAVSKSIGADGLSQSVGVNSKGIYANRIENYQKQLDDGKSGGLINRLRRRYIGIMLGSC